MNTDIIPITSTDVVNVMCLVAAFLVGMVGYGDAWPIQVSLQKPVRRRLTEMFAVVLCFVPSAIFIEQFRSALLLQCILFLCPHIAALIAKAFIDSHAIIKTTIINYVTEMMKPAAQSPNSHIVEEPTTPSKIFESDEVLAEYCDKIVARDDDEMWMLLKKLGVEVGDIVDAPRIRKKEERHQTTMKAQRTGVFIKKDN